MLRLGRLFLYGAVVLCGRYSFGMPKLFHGLRMDYQIGFWIAVVFLLAAVVGIIIINTKCNKYLLTYKPIKSENEKLKEANDSLKKKLEAATTENATMKADKKSAKKASKADAKASKAAAAEVKPVSELEQKLEKAKDELASLKEENYRLKQDNKDLRKDAKERRNSDDSDARALVTLRDERDEAKVELNKANARITDLEKKLSEAIKSAHSSVDDAKKVETPDQCADVERLQKENASLTASLKDVRVELSEFKKGYREQLDEAKKEIALEVKSIRDESAQVKRQLQQSKTRADNNHKIFLIARAQLMLAERKLMQLDSSYKPLVLGTSSSAIDDTIKKFLTQEARESRSGADIIERDKKIAALKEEIESLKAQQKDSSNSSEESKSDSINALVNSLAEDLETSSADLLSGVDDSFSDDASKSVKKGTPSLIGLSLDAMDENWDEL